MKTLKSIIKSLTISVIVILVILSIFGTAYILTYLTGIEMLFPITIFIETMLCILIVKKIEEL